MSMNAVFTCAVRYSVQAVCKTPLRTGAGETEDVLRDKSGQMFLQGASLAGAFREWFTDRYSKASAAVLFGSQEQNGHLVFSDGMFEPDTVMITRPRLRINGATGSADEGGKFDIAHAGTGSRFQFDLFWFGETEQRDELEQVEQMLSALHHGLILLGAQKSNGFGRVELTVTRHIYDMKNDADREDWLSDTFKGEKLVLPAMDRTAQVEFRVKAHADQILVKSGTPVYETVIKDDGKPVTISYTPNLEEMGKAVIPGSSIKGAVLSRVRAIADLKKVPGTVLDEAFGRMNIREGEKKDNGMAGKFRFEDVFPVKPQKQKIARIRIDRFTGGVIRQGLFREEPLTGELTLRITAPEGQKAACGLLTYALRDLGLGFYNLGSNGAIGRGYLKISEITAASGDATMALYFDGQGGCTLEDRQGLCRGWMEAVEEICHED